MKTNVKAIVGAILLSGSIALMAEGDQKPEKCGGKEKMGGGIEKRFEMMDKNTDGFVEKDEFKGPPQIFDKIDADKDGKITKEEMKQHHENKKKEFDTDGDGQLSAQERENMQKKMMGKGIEEQFKRKDKNGDGFLDKSEFIGPPQVFDKLDEDKDGKLSMDELKKNGPPMKMMKKGGEGKKGMQHKKGKGGGATCEPCDKSKQEEPKEVPEN